MGRALIVDARKVSGAQFMDALFGPYEDKRQAHFERCIRAIERGDTYGFPPMMVEHCRKLMAEREAIDQPYAELKRTGTGGWL